MLIAPVARFVAIVVGVVLVACASGAWFYTHFIHLTNVRELRDVRAGFHGHPEQIEVPRGELQGHRSELNDDGEDDERHERPVELAGAA